MRLVQLRNGGERLVAAVEEPALIFLREEVSVYALALRSIASGTPLTELVSSLLAEERIPYDEVYRGASDWHLLPPVDVPDEPQKLLVSGTGLTHLGSARERQAMHAVLQQPRLLPRRLEQRSSSACLRMTPPRVLPGLAATARLPG